MGVGVIGVGRVVVGGWGLRLLRVVELLWGLVEIRSL